MLATTSLVAGAALMLVAGVGSLVDRVAAQEPQPEEPRPAPTSGERLFQRDCAHCHGPDGEGTSRGPGIREAGTAGIRFMLTTGRMPISEPTAAIKRQPAHYSGDQIDLLVDYAESFTTGPEVPVVEVEELKLPEGGQLFRLHCAACHQMVGTGGVLVGSRQAPTLHPSTAEEVVEAIRFGPGTMPQYSEEQITVEEANAIASYVELEIRQPTDSGGISIGHFGPFAEGAVAWVGGIGGLLALAGWIGRRT